MRVTLKHLSPVYSAFHFCSWHTFKDIISLPPLLLLQLVKGRRILTCASLRRIQVALKVKLTHYSPLDSTANPFSERISIYSRSGTTQRGEKCIYLLFCEFGLLSLKKFFKTHSEETLQKTFVQERISFSSLHFYSVFAFVHTCIMVTKNKKKRLKAK